MLYLEAEVKAMMMLLFAVKDNTFFSEVLSCQSNYILCFSCLCSL